MIREIEILAPGGDIDCIKAAILAGADAVYCGLNSFNARTRATNIAFEDLKGILNLAHKHRCKVYLTLNIMIVESEIQAIINLLNKLINTRIDGIIVQDLGVFYLLSKYFKSIKIHASTQVNTHNEGQISFLKKLNTTSVNLSRELDINEIEYLTSTGNENGILTEVFVHGSYCISFSGICYMSSVLGGRSGNRGRCSQLCRSRFVTTPACNNFPLNLKDNSAYFDLDEILKAGVASIKIEGRMKQSDYVYTVVKCFNEQINSLLNKSRLNDDNINLYTVFNRDFSNAYLKGNIDKNMFIDNPLDHSIKHLTEAGNSSVETETDPTEYYKQKEDLIADVKDRIKQISVSKTPLTINVSGKPGRPLKISVTTPDSSFSAISESNLVRAGTGTMEKQGRKNKDLIKTVSPESCDSSETDGRSSARALDYSVLLKRFKSLNDTEFHIKNLVLDELQEGLFIPFKELSSLRKKISFTLNGSKESIDPIEVPIVKKQERLHIKPSLSVLISSKKDLYLCNETSTDIYFQLPDCIRYNCSELIKLFLKNKKLIPWFPSVLIGEDYSSAIKLLNEVKPEIIVTNNTGIAYEAFKKGIPWIAGPYLNIANTFSLLCLKDTFNCCGSFISNEISQKQIRRIINPESFKLYYSIYHPILLMTSRQCLHHQVIGCEKDEIDTKCIQECAKISSITNLNNVTFPVVKTKNSYHRLYNNKNFLNTDIMTDLPDIFTSFFIDLSDIKTETEIDMDKVEIIELFENHLKGDTCSKDRLVKIIYPTTNAQYIKGI